MNFYNYSKHDSPFNQAPTSNRSSLYVSPQISVRKRSNPRIQPINHDIIKIGLEADLKRLQGFMPFKPTEISLKLPLLPFRFSKGGRSSQQKVLTETSTRRSSRLSKELESESRFSFKKTPSVYGIQTKRETSVPDDKIEERNVTSYNIDKKK